MIKKIFMKKSEITTAMILSLILIVGSSCSKNSESETVKTGNANQSSTVLNNNVSINASVSATPSTVGNSVPSPTVDKSKNTAPPVKEPTPYIGSGASDLLLFTQSRAALSTDAELINAVIIEIKEGNVVLTGSVSSEAQKTKAAQLVQGVKGIKSVKNNLLIAR